MVATTRRTKPPINPFDMATWDGPLACYARVSKAKEEDTTIRVQVAECTRELERAGVVAAQWFTDENVDSEQEIGDRSAGGRVMRAVLAGEIRTLLVWKFDRLGRGFAMLDAINRLKKADVTVRSLKEPTTFPETPEGWMFCHILAGVGGFEKASIRTRIIGGQESAIRDRGRFTGGAAPYGYEKTATRTIALRHEPIPGTAVSEVAVIRLIYTWLVDEGLSTTRIADRLTEMGIPQRSHYRPTPQVRARPARLPWSPSRIRNLITDTTHKGEWTWGKRPLPHNAGREMIILPVEPIVTPLVWEAAQEALRANGRRQQRHAAYDYLLSGLIICGCCGLSYGGKTWQGQLPYYRCTAKQGLHGPYGRRGEKCPSLGIRADKLDALVWTDIRQFAEEIGPTLAEVRAAYAASVGDANAIKRRVQSARAELAGKVGERDMMLTLFRQGRIPASALDTQLAQIAGEEVALTARMSALEAKQGGSDALAAKLTEAEGVLREVRARLAAIEDAGGGERAAIVRKLVRRITVWTREIDGKAQPVAEIEYLFRKGGADQAGEPSRSTRASTPSSKSRTLAVTTSSSTPACKPGRTPTMPTPTATASPPTPPPSGTRTRTPNAPSMRGCSGTSSRANTPIRSSWRRRKIFGARSGRARPRSSWRRRAATSSATAWGGSRRSIALACG